MQTTTHACSASTVWRSPSHCALRYLPVLWLMSGGISTSIAGQIAFQALPALPTGPAPYALAVGDFNSDSKPDLAVVMSGNNDVYIYLGNGDATFSYSGFRAVGINPNAIVAADFNHDGKLDLAIANTGSGNVSILLGNGTGTFQSAVAYAVGANPVSIAADSFNPDGFADLVTANQDNSCDPPFNPCGSVSLLRGNGDGTFNLGTTLVLQPGEMPLRIATGAFTAGGDADIVVTNGASGSASIFLGDGDGHFTQSPQNPVAVASNPYGVLVADVDGDGKSDFVATQYDTDTLAVLSGKGDGTFKPGVSYLVGSQTPQPVAVATPDFDLDGLADLAVANSGYGDVAVLQGTTSGGSGFYYPLFFVGALVNPSSIAIADFNADGKPDIVVTNTGNNTLTVFLNTSVPADIVFANGFD